MTTDIDAPDRPALPSFTAKTPLTAMSDAPADATLEANEQDRAALADWLGTPGIAALKGTATAQASGSLVTVTGRLSATLARTCVVSLDPMEEIIDEQFTARFTTEPPAEGLKDEIEADLDAPERIEGDSLDLGEVLLEQLFLAMSAHPRKDDAEAPNDPGAGARISPFDVLGSLKVGDAGP